jgi:iron(III) transport system ATP-binding protein
MRIGIEGLAVRYDTRRIIDSLALVIESGTFFTLLGPSGCGKTTLLRAIAGFVPVESGRLLFGSSDVSRLPAYKRNIGMVFQDYALFPDKTVLDNVAYGLRARRVGESEVKRQVGEALERVGLQALGARYPAALSGGQRQRVALARALVIKPDVLLMDEPLSNLDAKLRHQVRGTITELQREAGITTVFVTHDQDEALAMSDRIGVMKAGRLEQVGTPAEIYRTPRSAYVADFVGGANIVGATLATTAGPGAEVAVELSGRRIGARAIEPLSAGRVSLVVRPEDITVGRGAAGGAGTVPARITRRQYLGAKTSYVATLSTGEALGVDCSGEAHDAYAIGEEVALAFDSARTLVLPP